MLELLAVHQSAAPTLAKCSCSATSTWGWHGRGQGGRLATVGARLSLGAGALGRPLAELCERFGAAPELHALGCVGLDGGRLSGFLPAAS